MLPLPVAKWYLERAITAQLLEERIRLKDQLLKNFEEKLNTQQQIINTYKNDSVYYNNIIATHEEWLKAKDKQITQLRKELKKSRIKSDILIGVGVGAIVGTMVDEPIQGMLLGGVVGLVRGLTRKK